MDTFIGSSSDIRHYRYPWFDRVLCNQSGPQEFHRYHHHNQDDLTDRHCHDRRGLFQNIVKSLEKVEDAIIIVIVIIESSIPSLS